MLTFPERLKAVIGPEEATHAWAMRYKMHPPKIWDWIKNERTPRRPQIAELADKTGIPLEWWLHGDLPAPQPGAIKYDAGQTPGAALHDAPVRSAKAGPQKINAAALEAILTGILRSAPQASPEAVAALAAKIYNDTLEAGLITATGIGDGHLSAAA